jgi:hypothetical protein
MLHRVELDPRHKQGKHGSPIHVVSHSETNEMLGGDDRFDCPALNAPLSPDARRVAKAFPPNDSCVHLLFVPRDNYNSSAGLTFAERRSNEQGQFGIAPMSVVDMSSARVPGETGAHELTHALLDTSLAQDDHLRDPQNLMHQTYLGPTGFVRRVGTALTPEQCARMRHHYLLADDDAIVVD